MPGVWLLDETYDYDAASQNFSTQTTTKRLQQSGSAPGIRVTVTANYADLEARAKPRNRHGRRGPKAPSPGERTVDPAESWDFASPRSRTHGSPGAARPNRNFTKLDQSVDAKTQAMSRTWDPHARPRPHTSEGYVRRKALNANDVQLKLRPETSLAGVGGHRRIEVVRPVFRPPRLAEQEPPPVDVAPAWAEFVEPPPNHPGYAAAHTAKGAARARADALQSQWLANLPRHLPTSSHWKKASALDDPTSGVFWSGSLHTPAVRTFMTPTVVHKTRSNKLRKTLFAVRTALYDAHPIENAPRPHTAPKYL